MYDQFRAAYITALTEAYANDPKYAMASVTTTPESYADRMIESIISGHDRTGDFFKMNPAIKKVAKQFGFKTPKTLREMLTVERVISEERHYAMYMPMIGIERRMQS